MANSNGELFNFDPTRSRAYFDKDSNLGLPAFRQTARLESASAEFELLQLASDGGSPILRELHEFAPLLSDEKEQDVQAQIDLAGFHRSARAADDPEKAATLRLVMGTDPGASTPITDTAFWALTAGMQLYKDAKTNSKMLPKSYGYRGNKAFGRRPIEVAGGLATFSVQIVEHKRPPWYSKLFEWARSEQAGELVSAIGLPGVSLSAVRLLDELLQRINDADSQASKLFGSEPMTLALTKYAADELRLGNPLVRVGALNTGWYVLTQRSNIEALRSKKAIIDSMTGKLVPEGWTAAAPTTELDDFDYAILKIRLKSANLANPFSGTR